MKISSELLSSITCKATYLKLYLESLSVYLERRSNYIDNSLSYFEFFSVISILYFALGVAGGDAPFGGSPSTLGKYRVIYKKSPFTGVIK